MFWGIKLQPNRDYTQKVDKPFQLTSAILDVGGSDSANVIQVNLKYENEKHILCNLSVKHGILQVPLMLEFDEGEEITFSTTGGKANVYLSGNLTPSPYMEDDEDEDEDGADILKGLNVDEDDDDEEEEDEEEEAPKLVKSPSKKRKSESELQPSKKKSKLNLKSDKPTKPTLTSLKDLIEGDDLEESEDDDDFLDAKAEEDDKEDEEDDDDDEEEEDDDDDEEEEEQQEEEEDDDDDDEDEEEEEEEEEVEKTTVKQGKHEKKNKEPLTNGLNKENKSPNKKGPKVIETKSVKKEDHPRKTLSGGVVVQELKAGEGKVATTGKNVQVYYEGRLKSNGKVFDKCVAGNPFKFRLGGGEVIAGWDIGVAGMKVGQKRRITCPPAVAYGKKGSPPQIPPNSTLMFDVELRGVN